jgi:hypothetical protein
MASGEFELLFGREPAAGDILRYSDVAFAHSQELNEITFGLQIEAWKRQLPHLPCPLRFEDGRLFQRRRASRSGALIAAS